MRIGTGYDVHRLGDGEKLVIGGVLIPYDKGLIGHSDADVLLHAIMDALLGAAALGDIGKHFPDTDEKYRGISSVKLLETVGEMLAGSRFIIENIDATIIAQQPKMRPYIDTMRDNIAKALGIEVSQVNVKATTEEGLGFTGSGEGISSNAVCLLSSADELTDQSVTVATSDGDDSIRSCEGCSGCTYTKAPSEGKKDSKKDGKKNVKKDVKKEAKKDEKKDSKKDRKTKNKKK
ncbi:MAG: 2-C-methyl-D-erythritol 2,4-cyclodiphosphate synthase [Lachnospiraceae bacterium]|nr:2-C-methyl-D-erythritol 2,4-cyclodiphosphate synthase [Lachnospiraceae bacterium]